MEDQRQGALVAALLTPKSRRWFSSTLISFAPRAVRRHPAQRGPPRRAGQLCLESLAPATQQDWSYRFRMLAISLRRSVPSPWKRLQGTTSAARVWTRRSGEARPPFLSVFLLNVCRSEAEGIGSGTGSEESGRRAFVRSRPVSVVNISTGSAAPYFPGESMIYSRSRTWTS